MRIKINIAITVILATMLSAVLLISCLATPVLSLLQSNITIPSHGMINQSPPIPPPENITTFYKRGVIRSELVEDFQPSYFSWKQHHEVESDYDKMKSYGIEVVRVMLNKQFWTDNVVLPLGDINGVVKSYRQIVDDIVSWTEERGMYLILESWTTEYWNQPLEEAAQRMYLEPRDFFINWMTEIATRYANKSHVILGLVNEPANRNAGIYDTEEERWDRWWQIAKEAVESYRAVKPNGYIIVQSVGFRLYKNFGAAYGRTPLPYPNIIYGWHNFYHWDLGSIVGKGYAPHPYATAYWNGDFVTAKQKMEQWYYDVAFRLQEEEGVPVWIDEFGAWVPDNNWDVWLRDFYDVCRTYQVGWTQLWWHGYWGETQGTPENPAIDYHLLNYDWQTLSPIGEIWAEEMLVLP